jgi:hypothetical protein
VRASRAAAAAGLCACLSAWTGRAAADGVARAEGSAAAQVSPERAELAALRAELERMHAQLATLEAELALAARSSPQEERIQGLEAQLGRLRDELRRLGEQARQTGNALDALAEEQHKGISLSVYGTLDATAYEGEHAILDGRLFELVLSGRPHKRLSFIAQAEFERAASVGGERGGEIVVEQAYATLSLNQLLNLRAGAFLVPFGNVGADHFPPKREVVSRPLVAEVVVPSDWTDNGVGLTGNRLVGATWLLSYEAYVMAGLSSQITGTGMRDARQGYGVDNNGDKALAAHVALDRTGKLGLGLSAYRGKYDDEGRRTLLGWGLDGVGVFGPFKVTGEFSSFTAARVPGPDARLRGFYVRGVYEFGRRLLQRSVLGRDFDEPRLAAVFQYDLAALDGPVDGVFERNRERRATWGMNYRPSSQWVLKLAYERNAFTRRPLFKGDRDGWLGSVGFIF